MRLCRAAWLGQQDRTGRWDTGTPCPELCFADQHCQPSKAQLCSPGLPQNPRIFPHGACSRFQETWTLLLCQLTTALMRPGANENRDSSLLCSPRVGSTPEARISVGLILPGRLKGRGAEQILAPAFPWNGMSAQRWRADSSSHTEFLLPQQRTLRRADWFFFFHSGT